MKNDLIPIDWLSKILSRWWVLFLSMLLCGSLGWVFNSLHPAEYEARAVITTSIDFGVEGQIGDFAEDQMITAVGDIIHSSGVLDSVFDDVQSASLPINKEEFSKHLFLDRQGYRWVLRYWNTDPEVARQVVTYWLIRSETALSQLKIQSIQGVTYSNYLSSLVNCLSQSTAVDPSPAGCNSQTLSVIRDEIDRMVNDPTISEVMSKIKLNKIDFEITQQAQVSAGPVRNNRGFMVLMGALVGLVVGLVILGIDPWRSGITKDLNQS